MAQESWNLSDLGGGTASGELRGGTRDLGFFARRLCGGLREGVLAAEVYCGSLRLVVLPTRGMSLWKAWVGETMFGWSSPVEGPVHPQFVPLDEPRGLGFLRGFDELLVRCGLASNGAPEFDASGRLQYPLHGRIANTPAFQAEVRIDEGQNRIEVVGAIIESSLHGPRLRLDVAYRCDMGRSAISIVDRITNLGGTPAVSQLLYHINFGPPLLDAGSRILVPAREIAPRDIPAANGIDTWSEVPAPAAGFREQVFFADLFADDADGTAAMLVNRGQTLAAYVNFERGRLPCLTVWKDTGDSRDGYVVGLEPGTNFPNPRSHEVDHGRAVTLEPGESFETRLELGFCVEASSVKRERSRIEALQAAPAHVIVWPTPHYSPVVEVESAEGSATPF